MEQANIQKRLVAYKIKIDDILNGKYVKQEGWNPNYIISGGKQISRVNVIGIVVSKHVGEGASYNSIIIDDGAKISARIFDDSRFFEDIEVGDVVMIVGKPREYGQEIYLVPEIVKKIEDKNWIEFRKLELKKQDLLKGVKEEVTEIKKDETAAEEIIVEDVKETSKIEKVLNLIKSMDLGEGVDYQEIIDKINGEKEIQALLQEGEIYEIRPGRLKVL